MSNGTEKQIAYANEITKEWRSAITAEIEQTTLRNDASLSWYSNNLANALNKFDMAIAQVPPAKIIEMKSAGVNPAKAMVKQAQQK